MRSFRRFLNLRVALVAFALVFGIATYVGSLPQSEALVIAGPSVCVYYNNANHSKVVGARGTGCCGEVINWGHTTPYVSCERLYCLDVLCPF